MKGETFHIKPEYFKTSETILAQLMPAISKEDKFVICISGESGSGKSVTAVTISQLLDAHNIHNLILHMDDYFILPPQTNHNNRVKSLENVGPHEVKLDVLQQNINDFKNNASIISKPIVDYHANSIDTENVSLKDIKVLIIEGTYVAKLEHFDTLIFMERTYKETYQNRKERNREAESDFIETVLEIEHKIISTFKDKSDIIIDKTYHAIINK